MSGVYGTIKPANIDIENDVTIYYNYKENRGHDNISDFTTLNANNLIVASQGTTTINGLYNLKLPLQEFGKKGLYTIYITPKEYSIKIHNVATLVDYPDVRGIIFNMDDLINPNLKVRGGLVGYRVDYGDFSRIITSSNYCAAMSLNGLIKYRLTNNQTSNLLFCTVTPSAANGFNPTDVPDIGTQYMEVKIVNTKFNPVMFEIEMVEHDAETLSYMIGGTQVRNLDNGIFTTYNDNNEIFKQYDTYTIKTQLGKPLYDVKEIRKTIDTSQSYNNIISEE